MREEGEPGEGTPVCSAPVSSQADGDALHSPVNLADDCPEETPSSGAADAAPREGTNEDERLYSPVNSGASGGQSVAWENRPVPPDGSRLVAALTTADGGREPFYIDPAALRDPDPLAEVMRALEGAPGEAEPPHLNPG